MITLADLKTFLGITDTAQDALLTLIVDGVNSWAVSVVGDILYSEKTINVKCSNVRNNTIWGCHKNIVSISDVNGTDFTTKVNFTDYIIYDDDTFKISDLSTYITGLSFDVFQVKYFSGYTTAPQQYINALLSIAGFQYTKAGTSTGDIKKEKLGPREYEYFDSSSTTASGEPVHVQAARDVIMSYIPSHFKCYG